MTRSENRIYFTVCQLCAKNGHHQDKLGLNGHFYYSQWDSGLCDIDLFDCRRQEPRRHLAM